MIPVGKIFQTLEEVQDHTLFSIKVGQLAISHMIQVADLSRQASIKTKNNLMTFYDSSWKDFPDTGRSTGSYIIFY